MLKAIKLIALCAIFSFGSKAQVLYNESFSTLSLLTYSSSSTTFKYALLPASFTEIRDNYKNDTTDYNRPYTSYLLKRAGWAVYNSQAPTNDTFLVATSWLDTSTVTKTDRWIITPTINNITASSVLSWRAMAPDANNRDGYEVYVTANTTGSLTVSDFNSSNKVFGIYDVDDGGLGEETVWTKRGINLGAYAGQSVKIAFRANSKDKFQIWLDDIKVENVTTGTDLALTGMDYSKYIFTNTASLITATIENRGGSDINSAVLSYSVGSGFPVSQGFTFSPPLYPYTVAQVTLGISFSLPSAGYNTVKVYVSGVNGVTDNSQADDTLTSFVNGIDNNNYKKVLLKKYVSAAEGWTPDAQQVSEGLLTDTNLVVMAVHRSDSMATAAGNAMIATYSATIPSGGVDNKYWPDLNSVTIEKTDWQAKILLQEAVAAPVKISVLNKTYNTSTRALSFDVKLDFATQLKGPYHLNTSLIENNVCGPFNDNTLNGWNQLSNLHSVPASPYYLAGAYYDGQSYILNAYEYKHRQVMISALDGATGDNALIPSTVNNGQSLTKHYSYVLPPAFANGNIYNADNIYIVSYVEQFDTELTKRQIVNTAQSKLTSNAEGVPVSVQEQQDRLSFNVYPNPAAGRTSIVYQNHMPQACVLSIANQLGEVAYSASADAENGVITLDVSAYPEGIYFVTLQSGGRQSVKKLVISR